MACRKLTTEVADAHDDESCVQVPGTDTLGVVLGDVDDDGALDLLYTAGRGARIQFGDGKGQFKLPDPKSERAALAAFEFGAEASVLGLADLDGDGDVGETPQAFEASSKSVAYQTSHQKVAGPLRR